MVYEDGCFAPADGSNPISIIGSTLDIDWVDVDGKPVSYGQDGENVTGVTGRVELRLEGGRTIGLNTISGRWAQRYGGLGGGLNEVQVVADDGSQGNGVYELTGAHHHRWFPVARSENLPPNG